MKKYIWMLLFVLFLTSCGKKETEEAAEYQIYYVNKESTALASQGYDAKAEDVESLVKELVEQMNTNPRDTDMHPAKPASIADASFVIEDAFLYMDYGAEYAAMDTVTEVLYRAATVKTLTQISGIEGVSFQVAGTALTDKNGNVVGMMTADSFVDNTSQSIGSLKRESLTLYFADEEGISLRSERVDVVYNGNLSLEKLVMEQLIAGPQAEGYLATIPSGTSILNISVKDGTCYVNLDGEFQKIDAQLTEQVVIYSIVNSLTELGTIQKVQIAVNGETDMVLRESLRLDQVFERNLELIKTQETE